MECHEMRKYIPDYIDCELPLSLKQLVDEHTAECLECRNEITAYQKTRTLLQLRSVPDPGDSYWETTWEAIKKQVPARVVALAEPGQAPAVSENHEPVWMRTLSWIAGVAAVLLLSVSAWNWYHSYSKRNVEVFESRIVLEPEWGTAIDGAQFISQVNPGHPEAQFAAWSRAALGSVEPIAAGAALMRVEAFSE